MSTQDGSPGETENIKELYQQLIDLNKEILDVFKEIKSPKDSRIKKAADKFSYVYDLFDKFTGLYGKIIIAAPILKPMLEGMYVYIQTNVLPYIHTILPVINK